MQVQSLALPSNYAGTGKSFEELKSDLINDFLKGKDDLLEKAGDGLGVVLNIIGAAAEEVLTLLSNNCDCDEDNALENAVLDCDYELGLKCEICIISTCDVDEVVGTTGSGQAWSGVAAVNLNAGALWNSFSFEPDSGEYTSNLNTDEERYENILKLAYKGMSQVMNRLTSNMKKKKMLLVFCDTKGVKYLAGDLDNPVTISEDNWTLNDTTNEGTLSFLSKACAHFRIMYGATPKAA